MHGKTEYIGIRELVKWVADVLVRIVKQLLLMMQRGKRDGQHCQTSHEFGISAPWLVCVGTCVLLGVGMGQKKCLDYSIKFSAESFFLFFCFWRFLEV